MTAPGRAAKAAAAAVAACGPVAAANVSGVGRRPYEGAKPDSPGQTELHMCIINFKN